MRSPQPTRGPSPGPLPAGADPSRLHCVLCGMVPPSARPEVLRQLGAAPVVLTVCADADACVTRWMSAAHS